MLNQGVFRGRAEYHYKSGEEILTRFFVRQKLSVDQTPASAHTWVRIGCPCMYREKTYNSNFNLNKYVLLFLAACAF